MHLFNLASLLLTAASLVVSPVVGWPNAAGQCLVGQSSVGPPHLPSSSGDTSLSGNGVEVSVDGTAVNSMTPISVAAGTEHTITISSTGATPFKGYLVVLSDPSGSIADLSTALSPSDAAAGQLSTFCAGPGVVGVTQTSSEDKTTVSATFVLDQDAELALDVTVVVVNTLPSGGVSAYGYAGYQLVNSAADGGSGGGATTAPTAAPVATAVTAPTAAPVATAVTGAPVLNTTTSAPASAAPVTAAPATPAPVLSDAPSSVPTSTGGGGGFGASEYPSMLPSAGESEPSSSTSSSPVAVTPTAPTPTSPTPTDKTTSGAAAPTLASWVRYGSSALAAGLVAVLMALAL